MGATVAASLQWRQACSQQGAAFWYGRWHVAGAAPDRASSDAAPATILA
jgi:hypothetical protein